MTSEPWDEYSALRAENERLLLEALREELESLDIDHSPWCGSLMPMNPGDCDCGAALAKDSTKGTEND